MRLNFKHTITILIIALIVACTAAVANAVTTPDDSITTTNIAGPADTVQLNGATYSVIGPVTEKSTVDESTKALTQSIVGKLADTKNGETIIVTSGNTVTTYTIPRGDTVSGTSTLGYTVSGNHPVQVSTVTTTSGSTTNPVVIPISKGSKTISHGHK